MTTRAIALTALLLATCAAHPTASRAGASIDLLGAAAPCVGGPSLPPLPPRPLLPPPAPSALVPRAGEAPVLCLVGLPDGQQVLLLMVPPQEFASLALPEREGFDEWQARQPRPQADSPTSGAPAPATTSAAATEPAAAPAAEAEGLDGWKILRRAGYNLASLPFSLGNLATRTVGFETNWSPEGLVDGLGTALSDPAEAALAASNGMERAGREMSRTWSDRAEDPVGTAGAAFDVALGMVSTAARDLVGTPVRLALSTVSPVGAPTNEQLGDSLSGWALVGVGSCVSRAGAASRAARVAGVADDAARVAGSVADDAARALPGTGAGRLLSAGAVDAAEAFLSDLRNFGRATPEELAKAFSGPNWKVKGAIGGGWNAFELNRAGTITGRAVRYSPAGKSGPRPRVKVQRRPATTMAELVWETVEL